MMKNAVSSPLFLVHQQLVAAAKSRISVVVRQQQHMRLHELEVSTHSQISGR